ncbi:hypothetical protein LWI29_024446 [Acer saccharum]|uniref:Pentatricopeptide repeat-containing protein n=1 Tax=Acer saccharum TaxID=4024 RepID=A0AA39VL00_ACESA|nr:hypothetical protein LWI29_024446 [Acer saccharum]KAK1558925.1 hypothetical protein Q3G72_008358 [Acer saccharum]
MAVVQILKQIFFSSPKSRPNLHFLSFYYDFSTTSSPPSDQPNPPISTVVSILTHHRSKSRWGHILSLCPSGFTPTQFSQIALSLKNNPHLVLRFFVFTQRKSLCKHDLSSYATMIHLLSRGRLTSQAQELIRVAVRLPANDLQTKQELRLFEILVKTYRECGSAPYVFDLLITCCLEVKRIDGALGIVRMLLSRGICLKISTCNSLIWAVSRSQGVISGYEIYREVFGLDSEKIEASFKNAKRVVRIRPNVHTFNALMACFYREGLFERVEDTWIEMESLRCEPNCSTYSVLMAVLCEEGKMREAEKLLEEMRDKNVERDVVAYNTIIGGFCKIGEIGRGEDLFREMGLDGVESSCSTFEYLVNGHCRVGDVDSAISVYKDMIRKTFRPESSTVEALIGGLCDKRRISEAMEILRVGVEKFSLSPTKNSYKLLIKGLCEDGNMEEALKVQAEMVGKGFEPSLEIYNAFIDGYMEQGNVEMAKILRTEMLETQKREEDG